MGAVEAVQDLAREAHVLSCSTKGVYLHASELLKLAARILATAATWAEREEANYPAHGTKDRYAEGCRCEPCRGANRADHGTRSRYGAGCRCNPCGLANADYMRARYTVAPDATPEQREAAKALAARRRRKYVADPIGSGSEAKHALPAEVIPPAPDAGVEIDVPVTRRPRRKGVQFYRCKVPVGHGAPCGTVETGGGAADHLVDAHSLVADDPLAHFEAADDGPEPFHRCKWCEVPVRVLAKDRAGHLERSHGQKVGDKIDAHFDVMVPEPPKPQTIDLRDNMRSGPAKGGAA